MKKQKMNYVGLSVAIVFGLLVPAAHSSEDSQVTSITANTLRLVDGATAGSAKASDVAWLTGVWVGEGMGGVAEEAWLPPSGGSMVGAFKLLDRADDGAVKPNFYEFMTILEVGDTLELRLKHFNPDVTGWEEKADFVTFPLVKVDPRRAYFRGLTYELKGEDELRVYLAMKTEEGSKEYEFVFKRQ